MGAPAIAQRFGVSKDALHRHRSKHLSAATRAAVLAGSQKPSGVDLKRLKVSEAEGLLSQLVMQRARLQQHSDMALDIGDIRVGVLVERQITTNLELVSKLLGQLVHVSEHRFTSVLLTPGLHRAAARDHRGAARSPRGGQGGLSGSPRA